MYSYRGKTFQLSTLLSKIYTERKSTVTHVHPHRREAICLLILPISLNTEEQFEESFVFSSSSWEKIDIDMFVRVYIYFLYIFLEKRLILFSSFILCLYKLYCIGSKCFDTMCCESSFAYRKKDVATLVMLPLFSFH